MSYVSMGQWTVDLFGYDAIHEAFVKKSEYFSERKRLAIFNKVVEPGKIFTVI